ncbi:uncharacterized protein LOC134820570 isoform X1 [Bolinopsis microptera]|uniref:uncharacterized protein LOC134820570 isoform X1 n=1 Tax=Bolinopsis microptera TaxID=2820187 RepID=UPI00307A4361
MTQVMFHVLLFLSAFACFYSNDIVLTVSPSMDDGPIVWKQTVTISCNWTPGNRMYGDMVVGETSESLYSDGQYGEIVSLEDPEQRIYFVSDDDIGEGTLVIKDVTSADARQFGCMVSRKGNSNNINLEIIEPPMAGVVNFVAVPEFTTVDLTWDVVEGASSYNVGWQAVGAADWTTVDVATNSHRFEGLSVASNFVAKVDASNAAGIREGIEPAETSFTTKDNRPPHPVGGLAVGASDYNQTSITISWDLADNEAEERIVLGIFATVVKEGADDASPEASPAPQELGGDVTTATFDLGGPGTYIFSVQTTNDFSEGVVTTQTVTHEVKETTEAPTVPATTTPKPTTKKITTPKITTPKPITVAVTEPQEPKNMDCGPIQNLEPLPGKPLQLSCIVPEDVNYEAEAITWSYKVGDEGQTLDQEALIISGVNIVANNTLKSSTLNIGEIIETQAGTYKCSIESSPHSSECEYIVAVTRTGSGALQTSVSTAVSLVIVLLAFF